MSFMFNPYPYNDMGAVNKVDTALLPEQKIVCGMDQIIESICAVAKNSKIAAEGYIGVDFDLIVDQLKNKDDNIKLVDFSRCYKPQAELDEMLAEYLPVDPVMDPVSLFGRIFEGDFSELLCAEKVLELKKELESTDGPVIVYGCGCACKEMRNIYSSIIYCDMAPINIVLRARANKIKCIGDESKRNFRDLMRHLYYVDYEVSIRLRQELLESGAIDYYLDCNIPDNLKLIPEPVLTAIMESLAGKPFRCKPCYIEGIWGGDYIKNLRSLPTEMRNCAWVFDLIPNEVSLLVDVQDALVELPFIMFYRRMGEKLMGQKCVEKYHGVFPIRFNYDDTYHGGNMSTQVHPPKKYNHDNFNEPFQQDESYYVVFTAGSRTYLGLKDTTDTDEFYGEVKKSEKEGTPVDFEKYVNSVVSRQGRQFLIPGGTIHSSGANQVVLEIGSWTVGSYTFKIYDYLRKDLDGKPRPIHSRHGENVIDKSRREEYVKDKLVLAPRLLREGKGWAEYILGEHEKIFFQLRCLEFYKMIEDDTAENFHVLNLVEGQRVRIESITEPEKSYEIGYLEMAVVPACLGKYRVVNLGAGPVRVHKTLLKPEAE